MRLQDQEFIGARSGTSGPANSSPAQLLARRKRKSSEATALSRFGNVAGHLQQYSLPKGTGHQLGTPARHSSGIKIAPFGVPATCWLHRQLPSRSTIQHAGHHSTPKPFGLWHTPGGVRIGGWNELDEHVLSGLDRAGPDRRRRRT